MNTKKDKNKNGSHKAKILYCPYEDSEVKVDAKIAPLILNMWELEIHTAGSCQAQCSFNCKHKYKHTKIKTGPDKGLRYDSTISTKHCYNNVWIAFDSIADVELLFNYVAEYSKDRNSMYEKMGAGLFVACRNDNCLRPKDHWSFSFLMWNKGLKMHIKDDCYVEDGCGENNFNMRPQITFPHTHLQYVQEKLKAALKNRK